MNRTCHKNCSDNCLKHGKQRSESVRGIDTAGVIDTMIQDATEHGVQFTRGDLQDLLNADGEDEVTETVTLEGLGREVAGLQNEQNECDEPVAIDGEEELYISEQLKCLARARAILERHGEVDDAGQKAFGGCQRALLHENVRKMRKTTIADHFSKLCQSYSMIAIQTCPAYMY